MWIDAGRDGSCVVLRELPEQRHLDRASLDRCFRVSEGPVSLNRHWLRTSTVR